MALKLTRVFYQKSPWSWPILKAVIMGVWLIFSKYDPAKKGADKEPGKD